MRGLGELALDRLFLRAACDLFQGHCGQGGVFQRTVGNLFELAPGGLDVFPLRRFFLRAPSGRGELTPDGFDFVVGAANALFQFAPGSGFALPLRPFVVRVFSSRRQFTTGSLRLVLGAVKALFQVAPDGRLLFTARGLCRIALMSATGRLLQCAARGFGLILRAAHGVREFTSNGLIVFLLRGGFLGATHRHCQRAPCRFRRSARCSAVAKTHRPTERCR